MARRSIKVDIPISKPEQMTALLESIVARHQKLAGESPLLSIPGLDMTAFAEKITTFKEKRNQAEDFYAKSQALMQQARILLGADAGQSIHTQNTLYFLSNRIKQYLLLHYVDAEEELSPFGFNVVIKQVKTGRKKKPKVK